MTKSPTANVMLPLPRSCVPAALTIHCHPACPVLSLIVGVPPPGGLAADQSPLNITCPATTVSLSQKKSVPLVRSILPLLPVTEGQYFNKLPSLNVTPALVSVASLRSIPALSTCRLRCGTVLPIGVVHSSIRLPRPVADCVSVAIISMRTLLIVFKPRPSAIALPPKRTMISPACAGCGSATVLRA